MCQIFWGHLVCGDTEVTDSVVLQERLNSVVDELAQLKTQISAMTQNHSRDGSTGAIAAQLLQQAFVNLTAHIYQLEDDARRRQQLQG